MDSPVLEQFFDAAQLPIFTTPSKKRHGMINILPLKPGALESPVRRGIIPGMSPIKTPTGRAGLPSPRRKTAQELESSARKRAYQSTGNWARLMGEDEDSEPEDPLTTQDRHLAEAIIKQSRSDTTYYGSDVEYEEDITVVGRDSNSDLEPSSDDSEIDEEFKQTTKKRKRISPQRSSIKSSTSSTKRGRTSVDRKTTSTRKSSKLIDKSNAKKVPETNKAKHGPKHPDSDSGISEFEREEDEFEDADKENLEAQSPTPKKINRPPAKEAGTPKRKVGRPSRASVILGSIQSIFLDPDTLAKDEETVDLLPIKSTRNIFSGRKVEDDPQKESMVSKFIPMPIPKVNDMGEVTDSQFIEKYLNVGSLHPKLSDDGAIFLEGTEGYFEQHSVRPRTSGNSLSEKAPALEYLEFIPMVNLGQLFQNQEKNALQDLYQVMYPQWCFEMLQGFNLHFYGVGTKIPIINRFLLEYVFDWFERCYGSKSEPHILVVNGYNPAVKMKQIVNDVVSVFVSQEDSTVKFPKHVLETVPFLLKYLENKRQLSKRALPRIVLAIHNIDGQALRDEKTQMLLSQLCLIPEIWLVCSSDDLNVSLLWNLHILKNFNFVFHCTASYTLHSTEVLFKDILSMGRLKKFSGDRGAKYVLSNLTQNAKSLYRELLKLQMDAIDKVGTLKAARSSIKGSSKNWIELKRLYESCLEAFITSNMISFRTVLGEFMEHRMCNLTKDDLGTEYVYIPFLYGEMQKIIKHTEK